nr:hypothetical protein [Tanacetum cinerariifolium]
MKRGRNSESLLSRVSKSGTNEGGHWKSNSKRRKPADEEDLAAPWLCEEVDPFIPRIRNFKSSQKTRMPNNVKTYDGTGDPEDHVKSFQAAAQSIDGYKDLKAAFLAYFMQQKKYTKDPVEIHNIKQRDGKTIEDFMKRFKVKIKRMKGAPKYMQISGFMHRVNNLELTKRLNEHVPKTVEEMMIAIAAFTWGKTDAASKKKVHTPWKSQDQSKRQNSEQRSDFRNQTRMDGEIRRDKDQQKTGKKDAPVKDKAAAVYMIRPCQRVTRQKVTQSFAYVKEITFSPLAANKGTGGPLVIEAEISRHAVHRIYVDGGDAEYYTRAWMNFIIVRSPSPYNGIIGRPRIREIQAVPSTAHRMLKFSMNDRIVTIRSTNLTPTECTSIAATPKDQEKKAEARHIIFKVAIHPDFPDQEITIGGTISIKARTELCTLLKRNLDIFAWQPKKGQALERVKAIQVEVQKLAEAGILREVYYHDWLSNPIMVKKHDGSWRMCVDFTDLNKACPQDCYPLPEIDYKVESLCGHAFKCFLDAYKGYHQIQMAEQDEEKTAFHTSHGILPDFLFEKPDNAPPEASVIETLQEPWTLFTDGSLCVDGSGTGLILTSPEGTEFTYALRFQFTASNNEVEYEALIASLRIAAQMGVRNVYVSVDSKLVANQVLGTYVAKEKNMVKYLKNANSLMSGFANFSITQVPRREIVSDNGKQFSDNPFKDWCEKLNITQRFASVKHPQSNGLVKRANRSLGEGINAQIEMPTYRTPVVDAVHNNEELKLNLDLLEERCECAAIREAKAKLKMTKYYNTRVRGITFRPGDFVYRSNEASHAMDGGKLDSKWEGPYEVTEALEDGAYRLRSMNGIVLPWTWNVANLKKCYL